MGRRSEAKTFLVQVKSALYLVRCRSYSPHEIGREIAGAFAGKLCGRSGAQSEEDGKCERDAHVR
jgi:hypothetical protein